MNDSNIIDYTGKLNEHDDYLKMLDILEKMTSYIEIIPENEITKKFVKDIISVKKTSSWWREDYQLGSRCWNSFIK